MRNTKNLCLLGSFSAICLALGPSCDGNTTNEGGDGEGGSAGEGGTSAVTSIEKTIGPAGGTVEIDGASLTFPPGALVADTEIRLGYLTDDEIDALPGLPTGASYRSTPVAMTPHGLEFNEPVEVSLSYKGSSATSLAVGRLDDEDDETWEADDGPRFSNGKATFAIGTFSVYAVVEDPEGGLSGDASGTGGTGGTNGTGGTGGTGGQGPVCGTDEWLDPIGGDCESCTPFADYEHVCGDFVDQDTGMAGATSTGTSWNPYTNTLSLELREDLPAPASANVSFFYNVDDGGGLTVSSQMTVDGYLLSASFPIVEPLAYISNLVLNVVDRCGNENEISIAAGTDAIWANRASEEIYEFFCEF